MGVRNEDRKSHSFLELVGISCATLGFMAHSLPNMNHPWPILRNKQITEHD